MLVLDGRIFSRGVRGSTGVEKPRPAKAAALWLHWRTLANAAVTSYGTAVAPLA